MLWIFSKVRNYRDAWKFPEHRALSNKSNDFLPNRNPSQMNETTSVVRFTCFSFVWMVNKWIHIRKWELTRMQNDWLDECLPFNWSMKWVDNNWIEAMRRNSFAPSRPSNMHFFLATNFFVVILFPLCIPLSGWFDIVVWQMQDKQWEIASSESIEYPVNCAIWDKRNFRTWRISHRCWFRWAVFFSQSLMCRCI